uniref:Uncharacterized protein n=1 Tax=Schistosoma japonicum TaxID=6182 RepID=Q5C156_SCHJA|nr:unknown [Schistosoma japonicum]
MHCKYNFLHFQRTYNHPQTQHLCVLCSQIQLVMDSPHIHDLQYNQSIVVQIME